MEAEALDLIHEALRQPGGNRGLTIRQRADRTGLAVGYLARLLNASTCVLKRRARHPRLWWADWRDLPTEFRWRKRGRPKNTNSLSYKDLQKV